jgi:hypothetical protein
MLLARVCVCAVMQKKEKSMILTQCDLVVAAQRKERHDLRDSDTAYVRLIHRTSQPRAR